MNAPQISFDSSSKYFIETNEGGRIDFSKPALGGDATVGAYRDAPNGANVIFKRYRHTKALAAEYLIINNYKQDQIPTLLPYLSCN